MIIVRSARPRRSTKCVFEVGIAWIVAKRATEKKHEVRIRGWHCVDCHEARDREEARSAYSRSALCSKIQKNKIPY